SKDRQEPRQKQEPEGATGMTVRSIRNPGPAETFPCLPSPPVKAPASRAQPLPPAPARHRLLPSAVRRPGADAAGAPAATRVRVRARQRAAVATAPLDAKSGRGIP